MAIRSDGSRVSECSADARDVSERLAQRAEHVCRHYLPNGKRCGGYWLTGDVTDERGQSLFVRLEGPTRGQGAAGKWTDAATGQHGDLVDLIRLRYSFASFTDALAEAQRFLGDCTEHYPVRADRNDGLRGRSASARVLFAKSEPIAGTLAELYLRKRGILNVRDLPWLRFHPTCFYREDRNAPREIWPALIAAVTDLDNRITGVHRTWLSRDGLSKAPLSTPRRALGLLSGHGVRIGSGPALIVGEGLESVLSVRELAPSLPVVAALSASHLSALSFPIGLQRLYIAQDNDPAGRAAASLLSNRMQSTGIEVRPLVPRGHDWNDDLSEASHDDSRQHLSQQLLSSNRAEF